MWFVSASACRFPIDQGRRGKWRPRCPQRGGAITRPEGGDQGRSKATAGNGPNSAHWKSQNVKKFHTLRAGEGAWECKKTQMEAIMPLEGAHT